MYTPREDSHFIQKHIKEFCSPTSYVLDMGTGSGILAKEAFRYSKHVMAIDLDEEAIKILRDKLDNKKNKVALNKQYTSICFLHSNLFSKLKANTRFDLIIFNPPYLPSESKVYNHIDLDGGKHGTEIIERFLKEARKFLKKDGKILLLTSSLNRGIEAIFKKYNFSFKKIDKESFFFEKIFVWVLE